MIGSSMNYKATVRGLWACLTVSCVVIAISAAVARADYPKSHDAPGFTPLFNGKDLTGWKGLVGNPKSRAAMSADELAAAQKVADEKMRAHWKVADGALEFDGRATACARRRTTATLNCLSTGKSSKVATAGSTCVAHRRSRSGTRSTPRTSSTGQRRAPEHSGTMPRIPASPRPRLTSRSVSGTPCSSA